MIHKLLPAPTNNKLPIAVNNKYNLNIINKIIKKKTTAQPARLSLKKQSKTTEFWKNFKHRYNATFKTKKSIHKYTSNCKERTNKGDKSGFCKLKCGILYRIYGKLAPLSG